MKELTNDNYATETATGNTVVDFYGKGCGNCKMLEPMLAALMTDNPNVKFCKADIDNNPTAVESLGIMTLPTIVFYQNGKELEDIRLMGIKPKTLIQRKLTEAFGQ
jgi:thioredoxin 1